MLPPGVIPVSAEIAMPPGAHDLVIVGNPKGTTLRATAQFKGRGILVCEGAKNVRFVGFSIDGVRALHKESAGLPPSNVTFAKFTASNGILVIDTEGLSIARVSFKEVWGFAVIVSASKRVRI